MDDAEASVGGDRLEVPRASRWPWHLPPAAPLLDLLAKGIGTGRFVALQTLFLVSWIGLNVLAPSLRWDYAQPYPLILLTLIISAQAAYAAPLILLSQNKQVDLDRSRTARDRAEAARTKATTEYVIKELAALRAAVEKTMTRDLVRQELSSIRPVDKSRVSESRDRK